MKTLTLGVVLCAVAASTALAPRTVTAAATAEQKKQIADVVRDLGKFGSLIAKKDFDEAQKLIDDSEKKLKEIQKAAGIEDGDKLLAGPAKKIANAREQLGRKKPGAGGGTVSFEKDVAPLLAAKCLGCHGENDPKGNLRLNNFAGLKAGGDSGQLVFPKNPAQSPLVYRLMADGDARMPKNGAPLSKEEIKKISDWVAAGAPFSGNDQTPLNQLKSPESTRKTEEAAVQINRPSGGETVSFSQDIAPFMVNLCLNCHSGNQPRSGFSLETFEKLMKGGTSGRVVLPGNSKDSRLWHLVGEQDPIKMPQGQALITRTNHRNLKTWIEEGAKFDGADPKATLRSLVPTEAEKRAKELASLSNEELAKRQREQAERLWKRALASETSTIVETDGFIVIGNIDEQRAKQGAEWGAAAAERIKKVFGVKEYLRGKMTLFVFKDWTSYSEFSQTIENSEIPQEKKGHARVSAAGDEAYVCVVDLGDTSTETSPGLRILTTALLTEGWMQKLPKPLPDWATKGTGLFVAAYFDAKNPYFRGLQASTHAAIEGLSKPEEVFDNGHFSPSDLPSVGYTLVTFMAKQGGEANFMTFLSKLAGGTTFADALKELYNIDAPGLAQMYIAYVDSLHGSKSGPRKKK